MMVAAFQSNAFQSNAFQSNAFQTAVQVVIGGTISVVAYVAAREYDSLVADREFNARVQDRDYNATTEVEK